MPPLRTRAPLDVELEDKLIFGLTPVRFGYLAVGALAAYVLGAHTGVAGVLRMPGALLLLGCAAAVAWVRWRGRPLDAWLLDLAIFARRNFEIQVERDVLRSWRTWRRRRRVPTITVLAERSGAGATTVAVELGAALALKGRRVEVTQAGGGVDAAPRLGLAAAGTHAASGLSIVAGATAAAECVVVDLGAHARRRRSNLALLVGQGDHSDETARRRTRGAAHVAVVVNRDREPAGANPRFPIAAVIPDDPAVPAAQEQREPVILRFPTSRAAIAFRLLADQVDPAKPWDSQDSDRPRAG